VQQILFNLVGNALKFTQKGRIQIEISLLRFADQHTVRVLFIVSDTGIGIPDERIHDIFEAFTQVENAYTRYYQGAGLGLSITRNLVRLMDGSLAIADTDGGGTTVFVSLPMRICRAEKKTTSENKGREAKAIGRLRILLAEDDRLSAMAAEKMLEKAGAVVTTVGNGKQALEKLKDIEFDLVLMDVQMPVMDGVEATQRIREGRAGLQAEETPIIAMTSYAMPGDREKFLASGMDGYVAKPFVLKNLESEIADVLNQKEKAGTAD
jgi:CheY-like chemotaxis protein